MHGPVEFGAHMAEDGAGQDLEVLGVEGLRRGRRAVGHAGEGQQHRQLARALVDQAHGVLAHVLGGGVLQQVEAGNDGADRADQVMAQPPRQMGGQFGLGDIFGARG
jgi:hypothetical protein